MMSTGNSIGNYPNQSHNHGAPPPKTNEPNTSALSQAIDQLQCIFPTISQDIIRRVLEKNNGNIELAAEDLAFGDYSQYEGTEAVGTKSRKKQRSRVQNFNATRSNTVKSEADGSGWSQQFKNNRFSTVWASYTGHQSSSAGLDTNNNYSTTDETEDEETYLDYFTDSVSEAVDQTIPSTEHFRSVYHAFRAEAFKLRRKCDRLREQAQRLYLNGYDREAKELRKEAAELSERLRVLNWKAARHIFNHNNYSDPNSKNNKFSIDLHGLHAREAIAFLKERLDILTKETSQSIETHYLDVIVGRGTHQEGSLVLQPAVQEWLTAERYQFKWLPRYGTFQVQVKLLTLLPTSDVLIFDVSVACNNCWHNAHYIK